LRPDPLPLSFIIHVVRLKAIGDDPIDHLSIEDVKTIIKKAKPKLTILTHFGMTMIKAKPWIIAADLEKEVGLKVIAASDGMKLDLEEYGEYGVKPKLYTSLTGS